MSLSTKWVDPLRHLLSDAKGNLLCPEHVDAGIKVDGDLVSCTLCDRNNHNVVTIGDQVLIPAIIEADLGNRGICVRVMSKNQSVHNAVGGGINFVMGVNDVMLTTNYLLLREVKRLEADVARLEKEKFANSEQAQLAS